MPPQALSLKNLAPRYNVEDFQEDKWHAYFGNKSAKFVARRQLLSCKSSSRMLLNAGSGVYQIRVDGWIETAVDLFDAPIRDRENAVRANIEDLPFKTGSFGAVVCVGEVLGYSDPSKAISEFARVLTPLGLLVCDFGNSRSFRYLLKKNYGRAADLITDQYNGTPEPIWIYDCAYISSLLATARFVSPEYIWHSHLVGHGAKNWSVASKSNLYPALPGLVLPTY